MRIYLNCLVQDREYWNFLKSGYLMVTHTESPRGYLGSEEQCFYHVTGEVFAEPLHSILESGGSTAFTQSKRKITAGDIKT